MNVILKASLVGLASSMVPYSINQVADGYESGTRPLSKDEVVAQLREAAEIVQTLNATMLEVVEELNK